MPKKKPTHTIAVLDNNGHLIGTEEVTTIPNEGIVLPANCDLPLDGSYAWNSTEGAFFPRGHGLGKPGRPPIADHKCLYLIAKTLGDDMPQEVTDWVAWYEREMIKRGA